MPTEAQLQLQPASFRGVPFEVTAADVTVGRRTQVHEYPQRDKPFVEDLGRSKRTIVLDAFVVGKDYIEKMNALIEALETEGSGELIHPWLGAMTVTPTEVGTARFTQSLLTASITLTFVESGELVFPTTRRETRQASIDQSDTLEKTAVESFAERFDLSGAQDFVSKAVTGNLQDILQCQALREVSAVFDIADDLSKLTSDALTLLSRDPKVLGQQIANSLGLGRYVTTVAGWRGVAHQFENLLESDETNRAHKQSAIRGSSADLIKKNEEACEDLVRQIGAANLVRASSAIGTDLDRVDASTSIRVMAYDELIESRDLILDALDEEMLKTSNDDVYRALEDARSAVWADMTTRAEKNARLVSFTPPETMPAVVIAYDFYEDARRADEIVERNNLRHGGFVPSIPLKLMSE